MSLLRGTAGVRLLLAKINKQVSAVLILNTLEDSGVSNWVVAGVPFLYKFI